MNEEIKEIIDKLKDNDWYEELDLTGTKWIELKQEETNQLLDYITNLQEENQELKQRINGVLELVEPIILLNGVMTCKGLDKLLNKLKGDKNE